MPRSVMQRPADSAVLPGITAAVGGSPHRPDRPLGRTEEPARALWRSLYDPIPPLPDELPAYAARGAGSFCTAPAGAERTATIGAERAANPLLAAPTNHAFAGLLLGGLGSYRPNSASPPRRSQSRRSGTSR
jgi:hydroxyacylglutathione hydrolase